jgi:hypothetical protein
MPFIQPSAWNMNSRKFVWSILHSPTPIGAAGGREIFHTAGYYAEVTGASGGLRGSGCGRAELEPSVAACVAFACSAASRSWHLHD